MSHKSAGMQVTVDGLVKEEAGFTPSRLTDMFYKIIEVCRLKIQTPPNIQGVQESAGEAKVVGTCLTTKGHFILHGWATKRYFVFDAYSSEELDWEPLVATLNAELKVHTSHVEVRHRIKPKAF